jgi:hypothetical protein
MVRADDLCASHNPLMTGATVIPGTGFTLQQSSTPESSNHTPMLNLNQVKQELVKQANADYAGHPQYQGHWDSWVVGTITRRYTLRHSVLIQGQRVLVDPESRHLIAKDDMDSRPAARGKEWVTAYLHGGLLNIDTVIPANTVRY